MSSPNIDRRVFLQASSASLLCIGLAWTEDGQAAESLPLNAFVSLLSTGQVEVTVPRSEMGQGILTALSMCVADEMDVAWERVTVKQARADAERYGAQGTGGSESVRTRFMDMRRAGATARALLKTTAAAQWGVNIEDCRTKEGQVLHIQSGRKIGYEKLLGKISKFDLPKEARLKEPSEFAIIGKPKAPIDLDDMLRGRVGYGVDQRPPELLYAAVARCPYFGGGVKSANSKTALAIDGALSTVEIRATGGNSRVPAGIAVVAKTSWAALQARDALQIEWSRPKTSPESNTDHDRLMLELLDEPPEDVIYDQGETLEQLAQSREIHDANYQLPFLAHASLEPQNCTAQFKDDQLTIWAPTQTPNFSKSLISEATGLAAGKIDVQVTRIGGGFGRRLNNDYAVEAAIIAKVLKAPPVQVLWTREDDLQHDFYRPCSMHRLRSCLDDDGIPLAWDHHLTTPAIFAGYQLPPFSDRPGRYEATGAVDMPYSIPNRRCGFSMLPSQVPLGWWRAVSTTHTVFAVESFIDELAHRAGRDPLEYRLSLIDALPASIALRDENYPFEPDRLRGVLSLAADAIGWSQQQAAGRGLGIACCWDHMSYSAVAMEASQPEAGQIKIHRVVSALDCGLVVNPEGVRAQVEGCVIQGLSAALRERIKIENGRVAQSNFHDYPILRQMEAPEHIEVVIQDSAAAPTGAGEPALPAVAPALCNAVFAATRKRYRSLPLDRKNLTGEG